MWRRSCSGETLNIISFALSKKLKKLWTEYIPRLPFYSGNQRDIQGLDINNNIALKKSKPDGSSAKKTKEKIKKVRLAGKISESID
ncbi:hypothetical protein LDE01_04190 [Lactobacillus delbrueckii subsp. delbrueckii]|nr:hypothetical protein LDE01_04190 [Lactobacillus delbrueckii subsp. delbrueckii]